MLIISFASNYTCMLLPLLAAFLTAFFSVFFSIKKIIHIAHVKHLFDDPIEARKIHVLRTPNLGGVAIFASLLFTCSLFMEKPDVIPFRYTIVASLILFFIGVIDDLVGLNPLKKLIGQLVVAILIVVPGDIHFSGFYGLFGLETVSPLINIITSISFILLLINAFNLIDGINCLAGGIGLMVSLIFCYFFWLQQASWLVVIAASMSGGLLGFLLFNRTPAKIFMGDSGSLILGLIVSVFTIKFMELNLVKTTNLSSYIPSSPAVVLSLLIIPIFDTIRIFSVRLLNKKSPFQADRNHIHHLLIDSGLSHLQATAVLVGVTILCFLLTILAGRWGNEILISALIGISLILNKLLSLAATNRIRFFRTKETSVANPGFEASVKILKRPKKVAMAVTEE